MLNGKALDLAMATYLEFEAPDYGPEGVTTFRRDICDNAAFRAACLDGTNRMWGALDGGRIVGVLITSAVEAVTHKKLDPKYEGYLHAAGMILLLGLMAIIMFKDIFVLFKR